ncbi:MAG: regulatory iron-sulfur-containing complex subunit RicT [Phycisphaerae bacterium]|nr:regulatory iron-sulfur-containing complex subunit RicT [Phycisphaerae bacterium]
MAKTTQPKKYMLVRYGRMNCLSFFEHNESSLPKTPQHVVIKTDKGLELGKLVGTAACKGGQFCMNQQEVKEYFEGSEIDYPCGTGGKLIRFATAEDVSEQRHLDAIAKEEMARCREVIEEMNLPMKLVDAEHIFGGERIIYYFMADNRVDFRELVKQLAHEYQTRIEMRQIGARDEAKLLGDIETCGQPCCCQRFLKALKPVNMRMAKMQKATLDPTKISGYCGRLKCCLRYEDETYLELKKKLPNRGTLVKTPDGEGKVIDGQILTQLVRVEKAGGEQAVYPVDEIEVLRRDNRGGGKGRDSDNRQVDVEKNGNDVNDIEENGVEDNGDGLGEEDSNVA